MVRFNPLLCLGYLPSVNVCNFTEDLGVSDSIEISCWIQHWVLVSWESWGLRFYSGICSLWMYVMLFNSIEKYWQNQFPTTIIWSSLVILVYFGILTYFWKLLGYIYILEYIGDFWRSIIGVSSVDLWCCSRVDTEHLEQESSINLGMHEVS